MRSEVSQDGTLLVLAPASRSGGSQRYLAAALPGVLRGWQGPATVLVPASSAYLLGDLPDRVRIIPLVRPAWARGALHILPSTIVAARAVRAVRPSVVLTLGNLAYSGPGVPTVVVLNNAVRQRDLRWPSLGFRAYVFFLRVQYWGSSLRSTRAIAVSEELRAILPRPLRGPRTTVVHHGVAVTALPSPPRDSSRLRILLPGSVVPYRGLERVLRGISGGLPTGARLVVAGLEGSPRYRRRVERLAERLGLTGQLEWLGQVPHDYLLREMLAASHVVISSRTEACPSTLFEAAAVDPTRPVIAFDDRWSHEYAELLDARVREDTLAGALASTSTGSSPATAERRRTALADMTWERCVAQTLTVLRDAASAAATPARRRQKAHG
jgi:glycosyltransferase involved in cell wall biosynthesis